MWNTSCILHILYFIVKLFCFRVYLVIEDDQNFPFDINVDLLIPFAVVVVVCFITMISFMVIICCSSLLECSWNLKFKRKKIFAAFLTSLFTYFRFVNAFVTEDELNGVDCQCRRCIKYQLKSFHPKEVHLKRVPFVLTIM